jgi:hypothetical protein
LESIYIFRLLPSTFLVCINYTSVVARLLFITFKSTKRQEIRFREKDRIKDAEGKQVSKQAAGSSVLKTINRRERCRSFLLRTTEKT